MPGYSSFINIECCTNLVDRYYSLADRVPVLYAAIALDPDTKLKYFEIKLRDHPDCVILATTKSKELWTLAYRILQFIDTTPAQPATAPTSSTELEILPDD